MISPTPNAPASAFLALVRHARAEAAAPGQDDSERELSARGRAEFVRQLARLEAMGFRCDTLWTSPWRRARQTAELLGGVCGCPPVDHDGLCQEPGSLAGKRWTLGAAELALGTRVALVGHQPWLAQIARSLGALEVREIECGEVIWLASRGRAWAVAARLFPD